MTKMVSYAMDNLKKRLYMMIFVLLLSFFSCITMAKGETYYRYYYEGDNVIVTSETLSANVSVYETGTNLCKIGDYYILNQSYVDECPEYISYWNNGNYEYFVVKLETAKNASDDYGAFYCLSSVCNPTNNNPGTDTPIISPDPYKGVEKCEKGVTDEINYIVACGCIPANIADIMSRVYYILRVVGPILLIIVGGIEMAKAVATQDESSIEKAKKKLVNKAIAAAAIFVVFTIIKLGVSIVRDQSQTVELYECLEYLLNGYNI